MLYVTILWNPDLVSTNKGFVLNYFVGCRFIWMIKNVIISDHTSLKAVSFQAKCSIKSLSQRHPAIIITCQIHMLEFLNNLRYGVN